jgi:hypothetical protein
MQNILLSKCVFNRVPVKFVKNQYHVPIFNKNKFETFSKEAIYNPNPNVYVNQRELESLSCISRVMMNNRKNPFFYEPPIKLTDEWILQDKSQIWSIKNTNANNILDSNPIKISDITFNQLFNKNQSNNIFETIDYFPCFKKDSLENFTLMSLETIANYITDRDYYYNFEILKTHEEDEEFRLDID